ncbi:MAG: YCF48-related protein, partial [Desulfobacterota bacterium]|nr:YCF48-related protein [Thermodesulfobacteriota bacterium]
MAVENRHHASIGFAGGPVFSIGLIPMRSSAVLLGTGTGIYKNINGQTIWTPANEGLGSTYVYDVVPDSVTATILYAATRQGIYTSTDDGAEWNAAGLEDYQVFAVIVNPVTTTYLAAGTPEGVFISIDGGTTWAEQPTGPPNTYAFAVTTRSPRTLYAGSLTDGFYKSTDFGTTWTAATSGPNEVRSLVVHPTTSGILFAGTNAGLYKSTDNGATWKRIANDFAHSAVYDLALNASEPSTIYAATDIGMYKTTNGGISWTAINNGIVRYQDSGPFARALALNPLTPTNLYTGIYSGVGNDFDVYKSTNSGVSWTQINRTLANTSILSLAFDAENPSIVYAGTRTMAVLKATDRGVSWKEANEGFTDYFVRVVAVNPEEGTVYAGTPTGMFLSTDSGATWAAASPNPEIYCITIDPFHPSAVYTGTNHGIFVTTDAGETWIGKNDNLTNPYVTSLAFHPYTQDELYAGTQGDGVFKSTSGGATWSVANSGLSSTDILALVCARTHPATLFAGTRRGIYASTDNGTSWISIGDALTAYAIKCIAVHPDNPAILYAGTENHGLYRSSDGGVTWTLVDEALTSKTVYAACFDPQDSRRILAGIDGDIKAYTWNRPPNKPTQPSPIDHARDQSLSLTLSWQGGDPDPDDTVTYRVFFGESPDFGDNETATVTIPQYTPGTLANNTTYYWKVIAVDRSGEQAESDVWSFTTIVSNPPNTPSNPSPSDGAQNQPLFVELSWSGGDPNPGDTVTYDVYFGMQVQPPLVRINTKETSFIPVMPLLPKTTYYWKIVARDNHGVTTVGSVWRFTTRAIGGECLAERVVGNDPEALTLLRRFRDEVLAATEEGRALINLYYG